MILPGKHIKLSNSILNLGAIALENMNDQQTVSLLWEKIRHKPEIKSFERFTLGLDLLYILELIDFNSNGIIMRNKK